MASGENFTQRVFAYSALLSDDFPFIEADADRDVVLKELRDLVDSVPHHIVIIGPDGERLYANRLSLDYFDCTIEDFRSSEFLRNFCHPEDFDGARSYALRPEVRDALGVEAHRPDLGDGRLVLRRRRGIAQEQLGLALGRVGLDRR